MAANILLNTFIRFTSRFTQWFPRLGSRSLDAIVFPTLGSNLLIRFQQGRNQKALRNIKSFRKMLVIADIHIGDPIMDHTAVSALRDFFPDAQIDFMIKKGVENLFDGHPDISRILPVFTGGQFPNGSDLIAVREISSNYDAVFNLCLFLEEDSFPEPSKVFHLMSHVPVFARNEWKSEEDNHVSYQCHRFIYDLLNPLFPLKRNRPFEKPQVFLSPQSIREAEVFLGRNRESAEEPVVFLNPDTASLYTRIPIRFQEEILKGLAEMQCLVLVGEGHTDKGIGERLIQNLPPSRQTQLKLVPASFGLETYAAMVDLSDVFISGDTGPLHLAAAKKRDKSSGNSLRNRTAILSVFGGTPPRFSGYDSRPGYMESGQDAPCHAYQSVSLCRNISCMHKMGKVCDPEGCFGDLDVRKILSDIQDLIKNSKGSPVGAA